MRVMEITEASGGTSGMPTFYHGTTTKALPAILQHGLTPQAKPESFFRNNASTIAGWTNFNVYLSTDLEEATHYAQVQAGASGARGVVLVVRVPDPELLFPDDDAVQDFVIEELYREWDGGPSEALRNKTIRWVNKLFPLAINKRFDQIGPKIANFIEPEDFSNAVRAAVRRGWQASVAHNNSVAYRGVIPPGDIEVLGSDHDPIRMTPFGQIID